MEWVIFITIVYSIVLLIGIIWLCKDTSTRYSSKVYIYPKTEHRYLLRGFVKSKNPNTGEWYLAVRYTSISDNKEYIREHDDFFDKFINLKDWENGNKERK